MLEEIRNYILTCPFLKNDRADVLIMGEKPVRYCIKPVETEPLVKKYADGTALCKMDFLLMSKEKASRSVVQNISNNKFFEDFSDWIFEQNKNGNLPELSSSKTAVAIEVTGTAEVLENNLSEVSFAMKLRLVYIQN